MAGLQQNGPSGGMITRSREHVGVSDALNDLPLRETSCPNGNKGDGGKGKSGDEPTDAIATQSSPAQNW
jgi:hypothetical protein